MRSLATLATLLLGLAVVFWAPAAKATLILWDYSPVSTGAPGVSFFLNTASGQNFGELATFSSDVQISAMDIWTIENAASVGLSVTVRIWNDADGAVGSLLTSFIEVVSIVDDFGTTASAQRRTRADFSTAIDLDAGSYWFGMSGTTTDLSQLGLSMVADGQMQQFNGLSPSFLTNTGDMAFRLEGATTVPEPTTLALFATGLAGLGFMMRRRRRSMQLKAA